MRTINFKSKPFAIGKKVIVIRAYNSGTISLFLGMVGKILGESYHDIPDLGLFKIRVIDIDFGMHKVSIGQSIAEIYLKTI